MTTIRMRLSKMGAARFISHLDLMRAVERAIRRARLPVGLTEGFHPHFRIAYGHPLPLGMASRAEFLDADVTEDIAPDQVATMLNNRLSEDIRVVYADAVVPGISLTTSMARASYRLQFRPRPDRVGELTGLWQQVLEQEEHWIERQTPKGLKRVNIRPGIHGSLWESGQDAPALRLLLGVGSDNLRPDDAVRPLLPLAGVPEIMRTGQYGLVNGLLTDPFGKICRHWPDDENEKE